MLLVSLWWTMLPVVLVLGTISFLFISWTYKKELAAKMENVVDAVVETSDVLSEGLTKVVNSIKQLAVYQPKDRKENFIITVLGNAAYSTIQMSQEDMVVNVLIQRLIEKNWVVEAEMQDSTYEGQVMHVVCSKELDDEGGPEVAVLEFKLQDYSLERIKSKNTGLDLQKFTIEDKITVTDGIKVSVADCDMDCQLELRSIIKDACKAATVQVQHFARSRAGVIPIKVYNKEYKLFVDDTISTSKTASAVLELSYNINRRKIGANNASEKFRLKIGKFIEVVVQTTAPVDANGISEQGRRFNIGLVGPASSGKSYLLKALLEEGSKHGVNIIKSTAGSFATFKEDQGAMSALKRLAEKGPTWLVIDEANGLPVDLVAALASVMEGLDSSPNLSVILATNREADLSDTEISNLFREGRVDLLLDAGDLEPVQWKPLLDKLKVEHPELVWTYPAEEIPMTLGKVYACGQPPSLEGLFQKMVV